MMSNDAAIDLPSGLDELTANKAILSGKGAIQFIGFNGQEVAVYDAAGVCLNRSLATENIYEVEVTTGVYVAAAGDIRVKVMVK